MASATSAGDMGLGAGSSGVAVAAAAPVDELAGCVLDVLSLGLVSALGAGAAAGSSDASMESVSLQSTAA